MWLYLVFLYQVSSIIDLGVKLGGGGVTSFTWDYIGKTLELSLYVAVRPRVTMLLYLVGLYQECPNYSPGSNLAPPQGSQFLHGLIKGKLSKSPCT